MNALLKKLSIISFIFITFFLISCSDEEQVASSDLELPHLYRITEQLKSLNLEQKKKIEGIGFVLIEGGEFTMGSPDSEVRFRGPNERDENQSRVKISEDFFIGKFEVSNEEWGFIMNVKYDPKLAKYPKTSISHTLSMLYCKTMTKELRKIDLIPPHLVCRLPTEAEWEYACRAGNTKGVHGFKLLEEDTGDAMEDRSNEKKFMNSISPNDANFNITHGKPKLMSNNINNYSFPQFSKNKWGIYHMHGNAKEWCYDVYEKGFGTNALAHMSQEEREIAILTDPIGGLYGRYRVVKGGGFLSSASDCRAAAREKFDAYKESYEIGFRVVIGLPLR